jgi:hypothetical protein
MKLPVAIDNTSRPGSASKLPDKTVYHTGGILLPDNIPNDPDIIAEEISETNPQWLIYGKRCANGLRPRHDLMARLMARGLSVADSYRAAYNRYDLPAITVSQRAASVTKHAKFIGVLNQLRADYEQKSLQNAISVVDFVKGRLVLEAQSARNDGARIRALELLGKTESMFVDVKRNENVNVADLDKLKAQLEQRLRGILKNYSNVSSLEQGTAIPAETQRYNVTDAEIVQPEPHAPITPLLGTGFPSQKIDTIPPTQSGPIHPNSMENTPTVNDSAGYDPDFSGPLILNGGLRDTPK